jgi:hypothetical protein
MDRMKLLDLLDTALSEAELTELSRQLTVSFAAFPGRTKRDRTREFLGYVGRQGRDAGLAEALVALRPDLATPVAHLFAGNDAQLDWLDQLGSAGPSLASGVTLRWPKAGEVAGRPLFLPVAAPAPDDPPTVSEPPRATPYTPGRRVTDEAMFFGRDAEHAALVEALAAGGHVAIVAARSFGASSLLHHVAAHTAEPQLAAVADLKDPAWQTRPALLNGVWSQWWARVKPGHTVAVGTLAEFATAARKLHAAGFQPRLFLDELEQLVWRPGVFDDALFDAWLELGREGAIGFVATTHVAPAELFAQGGYQTRFYDLFRQFDLGLLDGDAAWALLTTPAERAGLAVPAGAAEALLAQAGPQPFFLQLAGYYLLMALAEGEFDLAPVMRRFQAAAAPHWQELWDSLSPLAQSHYPTARVGDAGGMAGRQLRLLANRGLVVAGESGFRPFSDGFAAWVGRLRAASEAAAVALRETTAA